MSGYESVKYLRAGTAEMFFRNWYTHPKTLIEMWIICLDPVWANSKKDSEWAEVVRVG